MYHNLINKTRAKSSQDQNDRTLCQAVHGTAAVRFLMKGRSITKWSVATCHGKCHAATSHKSLLFEVLYQAPLSRTDKKCIDFVSTSEVMKQKKSTARQPDPQFSHGLNSCAWRWKYIGSNGAPHFAVFLGQFAAQRRRTDLAIPG